MPTAKSAEPARKPVARKPVQKKLAVGASGDRLEREADRVARRAVDGGQGTARIPPTISALGAQRDATDGGGAGVAPPSVEASIGRMQAGGGRPLESGTRAAMESSLGHDFSGVRVHDDAGAADAAQALQSRAFTVGRDVFFNAGQYRPHTRGGRELIAHELTHTVQQAGGGPARRKVQRSTPPGTATTSPTEEDQTAAPPSTVFTSTRLPGGGIDTTDVGDTRGTVTLPVLGLPRVAGALKGTAGGQVTPVAGPGRAVPAPGAPFTLGPVPARGAGKAYEVWTAHARSNFKAGVRAKLDEMLAANPNVPELSAGGATVYYLKFKRSGEHVFIGTLDELSDQDALLRPQWNRNGSPLQGRGNTLDADHFLELQIGGNDAADNMFLLKGSYNSAVGSALKTQIDNALRTILNEVKGSSSIPATQLPTDVTEIKRNWTIHFSTVAAGNGFPQGRPDFWTPAEITAGTHLEHLKFMTEADLVAAGLRLENDGVQPRRVRIFPGPGGGAMRTLRLNAAGQVVGSTFLYRNIWVTGGTYLGGVTDQAETRLLSLDVLINKVARGATNPIAEKRGTVDVLRDPRLGIAGHLSRQSLASRFASMDFTPLSPLTFADMEVNAEGALVGTGSIAATKALFPGLNVPLVLYGDRVMISFPIPTENLSLGPLTVSEAALSLGVGPQGMFLEGYAGFLVDGLGSGSLTAELDRRGPRLVGMFTFDTDFFTPAQLEATYDLAADALTVGGTLGVESGRLPGVASGVVTVLVSRDRLDFNGTITLAAPLAGTVINVAYTQAQGLHIGADNIALPLSNLPAVQNATMSIAATRSPEGIWSFSGTGTATLAVPGATGTISLVYLDGAITMTAAAAVSKGPASGTLNVTATNAPMDDQGQSVDGPPTGTIRIWGAGTVTIRFGNLLTGTAGIELTQDNRIILSGTIALPPVVELFGRRNYGKDLLRLRPPEFPIWGISVAGIGVGIFAFVDARVSFDAYVGAGVIRDAAITAEMDLDHPELATVHGHGEFYVPAYAGLTLDVGGGLRARAAIAYAEGRVGLQGTLGIEAEASAALDVDWNPTSGLAVETRLAANVRPKFRLAANASVTVGVDLLFTDVSHTFGPWERVLGEFGPDMELGVEFPVRWSEAGGLDLSLDNIVVRQPSLDAPALMRSVFDALAP